MAITLFVAPSTMPTTTPEVHNSAAKIVSQRVSRTIFGDNTEFRNDIWKFRVDMHSGADAGRWNSIITEDVFKIMRNDATAGGTDIRWCKPRNLRWLMKGRHPIQ